MMDHQIQSLLQQEWQRQCNEICFIASENLVSSEVMIGQSSVATNKYAEGMVKARYYGGCDVVDQIETLAIERCRRLFGVKYVNVQPHSGASANLAVMLAVLEPGDKFMGLALSHGGHLSHGADGNVSSQVYQPSYYHVDEETGLLDYDAVRSKVLKERPKLLIAGYSAYAHDIEWKKFRQMADEVGAILLADISHISGMVAAKLLNDPAPYAHIITSTTHKSLRGPRGAIIMVPSDEQLAKKIDKAVFPGLQGGPMMHTICAKAIAFEEALSDEFIAYQRQVIANAQIMHDAFVAKGVLSVTGSAKTHQFTLDCTSIGLRGVDVESHLGALGIWVNKYPLPFDKFPMSVTGGARLGSLIVTARLFSEEDLSMLIGHMADFMLSGFGNSEGQVLRSEVVRLCLKYPIPERFPPLCKDKIGNL